MADLWAWEETSMVQEKEVFPLVKSVLLGLLSRRIWIITVTIPLAVQGQKKS